MIEGRIEMRQMTRIAILTAALIVAAPPTTAVADGVKDTGASGGGTFLPFNQISRRCDFSETDFNGPTGTARPTGTLRSDGNTVTADVQFVLAIPATRYDVRLIQVPRPSSAPCWGADPGVAQGVLNTDGAGAATVTLSDAIEPGATGAWVWITRPNPFSQDPVEFYTTDFIAPI
jgi:hypothetical protein